MQMVFTPPPRRWMPSSRLLDLWISSSYMYDASSLWMLFSLKKKHDVEKYKWVWMNFQRRQDGLVLRLCFDTLPFQVTPSTHSWCLCLWCRSSSSPYLSWWWRASHSLRSRTLTPSEKNYSQLKLEALSLIFGVRKMIVFRIARERGFIQRADLTSSAIRFSMRHRNDIASFTLSSEVNIDNVYIY